LTDQLGSRPVSTSADDRVPLQAGLASGGIIVKVNGLTWFGTSLQQIIA
jgi:hypothetical protein